MATEDPKSAKQQRRPTPQSKVTPGQALKTATSYEGDRPGGTGTKYSTNSLCYPDDLLEYESTNIYGGNFVVFYINVHENSMLWNEGSGNESIPADQVVPRTAGTVAGSTYNSTDVTAVAAGAGAIAADKANIGGRAIETISGDKVSGVLKKAVNYGTGAAAGAAVASMIGNLNPQYKRMKQAIALHVPTDLSIRYSVAWESEDLAGSSAIMGTVEAARKALTKGNSPQDTMSKDSSSGVLDAGKGYITGLALKTPGIGQLISKKSGVVGNPKKEQLFKSVDFRTFTFTYNFFPRSLEEYTKVQNIIYQFKLHMHPEFKDDSQFLYLYPSEFDIFYYQGNQENLNLHRHTSCVLTDLSINYTPQGTFSTFNGGVPSQINITMTFKELALLSKETIMDGF
jgi:hypothetical protein